MSIERQRETHTPHAKQYHVPADVRALGEYGRLISKMAATYAHKRVAEAHKYAGKARQK